MTVYKIPEFEEYIDTHGPWFDKKPWSPEHEQIIRDYYGLVPTEMLAEKLDRSIKSIQDKAAAMGVKAENNRRKRDEGTH